jgi:hypothetical protein
MFIVLLALGILTAGAGVLMIGFGVPINEFSLGNTLIIAGTTALAGGLVVIAIALALRQLQQIAALLTAPNKARPVERFEQAAQAQPAAQRMPIPKHPQETGRPPEGRYAPEEPPADPIFERLRMSGAAPQRVETQVPPEEDAPLSPRAPRIPPFPADAAMPPEAQAGARNPEFRFPPKPPSAGAAAAEKPRNAAAQPSQPSFNDAWPEPGQPRADTVEETRAADSASVAVLKSGVVDGMAYTLYTDGSIEAELAQGVVRFGSIEELRNHLEKSA